MSNSITHRFIPHTTAAATLGFTLVELMIAVTLGLFITGATIAAFVAQKTATTAANGIADITSSGRLAINTIQRTLRSAGNMGCHNTTYTISNLSPPPNTISPEFFNFGTAVTGFEATGTNPTDTITLLANPVVGAAGNWDADLDTALAAANIVTGNDVLVIHGRLINTTSVNVNAEIAAGATSITAALPTGAANLAALGFAPNQIILLANCNTRTEVFSSNAIGANTINIDTSGKNIAPNLTGSAIQNARLSVANTTIYFIGVGRDGSPTLMMWDAQGFDPRTTPQNPIELAQNIENMQVLYGMATAGSNTVSRYVTADQVDAAGGFNSVINIKVALLSASRTGIVPVPTNAPAFTLLGTNVTAARDSRLRRVFETNVNLRNNSF